MRTGYLDDIFTNGNIGGVSGPSSYQDFIKKNVVLDGPINQDGTIPDDTNIQYIQDVGNYITGQTEDNKTFYQFNNVFNENTFAGPVKNLCVAGKYFQDPVKFNLGDISYLDNNFVKSYIEFLYSGSVIYQNMETGKIITYAKTRPSGVETLTLRTYQVSNLLELGYDGSFNSKVELVDTTTIILTDFYTATYEGYTKNFWGDHGVTFIGYNPKTEKIVLTALSYAVFTTQQGYIRARHNVMNTLQIDVNDFNNKELHKMLLDESIDINNDYSSGTFYSGGTGIFYKNRLVFLAIVEGERKALSINLSNSTDIIELPLIIYDYQGNEVTEMQAAKSIDYTLNGVTYTNSYGNSKFVYNAFYIKDNDTFISGSITVKNDKVYLKEMIGTSAYHQNNNYFYHKGFFYDKGSFFAGIFSLTFNENLTETIEKAANRKLKYTLKFIEEG